MEYGENNLILKYIKRSETADRAIRSEFWSEEEYESLEECRNLVPRRPGMRNIRMEAYCGTEREVTYTIGIYTVNR